MSLTQPSSEGKRERSLVSSRNFIRVSKDHWRLEESETAKPFIPLGCNYFDPGTGWPPRMWQQFKREEVKSHFRMMEDLGVNAIRVWIQWASFMPIEGRLSSEALDLCHELLGYARESGIRVNLTGPEFWEGFPPWFPRDNFRGYEQFLDPLSGDLHARFWELFAGQFAEDPTIYAYDLANEPFMPWTGKLCLEAWNAWVKARYETPGAFHRAWGKLSPPEIPSGSVPPPPNRRVQGSQYLLDYQSFREAGAAQWVERSSRAIRGVDRHHLITVGLHQSSFPCEENLPSRYTAFNPSQLEKDLDYLSLHWYPFGNPLTASRQPFDYPGAIEESLSLFLANCRYTSVGKPLVVEEFSYYGGGSPSFWGGVLPFRSQAEQEHFSRRLIAASSGVVLGWLNWPFQDAPEANDTSAYGGFYDARGKLKPWGATFRSLASRLVRRPRRRERSSVSIPIDRSKLLTDGEWCRRLLRRCHRLYQHGTVWDFTSNHQNR
jgi:hypothetical protein